MVKEKDDKELVVAENSPSDLINLAIDKGADLEKLEKLLTLKERYDANEAKKVFTTSFSLAQANIASVVKTKVNPQTHSKYADLADIIDAAKPSYTREGFSVIFYEAETTKAEHIRICADVLHKSGHKEMYYYDVPLDGVGIKGNANMTKIHAKASSTSYGRRYLMCMIWNIPTDDDDGNKASKANVECISDKEAHQIVDLIAITGSDLVKFLDYMNIESVEKMPKKDYDKAIVSFETKKNQEKNKETDKK